MNFSRKPITESVKRMMIDLISLIFTLRASRRLSSASLLRARHPAIGGIASPLSALHMKASDSCKIQVIA